MKTALFLLICILIGCKTSNSPSHGNGSSSSEASLAIAPAQLPDGFNVEATEDSATKLYYFEDLLFEGRRDMQLQVVDPRRPKGEIIDTTLHDTLYQDQRRIILGRSEELLGGVYKRYLTEQSPERYKVADLYSGPMAAPVINSDRNARQFRTMIKNGCKSSAVNFGGFYPIVEWGCGASCALMAMVDRRTGQIYFTDMIDTLDGHYGLRYQPDSRLLVVNAYLLEPYNNYYALSWCTPASYVWNEQRKCFELVEKIQG